MRIRVNRAGREVQVRWVEESFDCALSAAPIGTMMDAEGLIGGRFQAAARTECSPYRRVLRPFGMVARRVRRSRAFTIVELLVVITIIALLAALALPHLNGFGKSNSMTAATRQMLDDVAYARQKALLNRTTVYMVFVPPFFWQGPNAVPFQNMSTMAFNQVTNLFTGQYTMYALLSMKSVGDQPGRSYPKYLTPWRKLPDGVTIAQEKFYQQMLVNDTNSLKSYLVYPFATNAFPFPSAEATVNINTNYYFRLPCITFNPSGGLTTNQDDYIPLTRASVLYPLDANGVPQPAQADWAEVPPGSSTNDYHLIHISWLTGRAKLERKEIQ